MSKIKILDNFLCIFLFLIGVGIITLIIILYSNRPDEIRGKKVDDISIPFFSTLNFIEVGAFPVYSESTLNLGLAGRLILDCYTGICQIEDSYYDYNTESTNYYFKDILDYTCAEQCSYNGKDECDCNVENSRKKGSCSRKYDDQYEIGKYCYADNIIYNWKGKQYAASKKEVFTYYKNAKLKYEQCPQGTIYCGIIDDNENKLCVSSTSNCPINYLSENKLNENKIHSTVVIGNKTFYYTYDDDITSNRKIIGGLVADTDLLLNNDNEEKIIIDTDTISSFLADNKNLYKEVNLGYDPYKEENIDEKGNSYLRIFYNNKFNLQKLRDKIDIYNSHKKIDEEAISPIRKKTKFIITFGLISFISFLFSLLIFLCNRNDFYKSYPWYFFTGIFIIFYIVSFIFICINISKFNKFKSLYKEYDKFPRLINLIVFILYLVLFGFFIFIGIYAGCLRDKCKRCRCNICTKRSKNEITIKNEANPDNNKIQNDKSPHERQDSTMNMTNNNLN